MKIHFRKVHNDRYWVICISAILILVFTGRAATAYAGMISVSRHAINTIAPPDSLYYGKNILNLPLTADKLILKTS